MIAAALQWNRRLPVALFVLDVITIVSPFDVFRLRWRMSTRPIAVQAVLRVDRGFPARSAAAARRVSRRRLWTRDEIAGCEHDALRPLRAVARLRTSAQTVRA